MPPIFGICNQFNVIQEDITKWNHGALYKKNRKIVSHITDRVYFAQAAMDDLVCETGSAFAFNNHISVVADASLYHREQLINSLHLDITEQIPDAALILNAYLKWGVDCPSHLYGDFAFVVFDSRSGAVYCARDHLGVKPFFYALHHDSFVFASEWKTIKHLVAVDEKPDNEYLLDGLLSVNSFHKTTSLKTVIRLEAANYLQLEQEKSTLKRYWNPDLHKMLVCKNENEYIDLLREKLICAISERCTDQKNIASELSGGLDSSAVTGIADRLLKQKGVTLHAYSNLFPKNTDIEFTDEGEFIAYMCTHASLSWEGISKHSKGIIEILHHSLNTQGCYIPLNYNIFNQSLFAVAAQKNIRILLSGFGGDELVSARIGIPWNELIQGMQWSILVDELFYRGITFRSLAKMGMIALNFFKSLLVKQKHANRIFTRDFLDNRFASLPLKADFVEKYNLREKFIALNQRPYRQKLIHRQWNQVTKDVISLRLETCYAAAAQYGIEYRYPLLDVDLVETALAFPPWLKQHYGVNRYMFREAIKGFVPEEIRLRNDKLGSTIPQTLYHLATEKEELFSVIREAEKSPYLKEIFDFPKFETWYEKLVRRDPKERQYLLTGTYFTYLMILMYYTEHPLEKSLMQI
jgi:asparagine synthase (glutamine-hydrolysing)